MLVHQQQKIPMASHSDTIAPAARSAVPAFGGGAVIGALGGLIGLGGAEFRLPLLIGAFRFAPLEAIILNKAMNLVVVASAFLFRTKSVPIGLVADNIAVILNLLAGSLLGAWCGASWATRLHSRTLYKLIAALLVSIGLILMFWHASTEAQASLLTGASLWFAGAIVGFAIGVVASLLGVAGGELLIPTFVLLFGIDIKLAGSLSLAVSLPTMLVGFARYSRDGSFTVLKRSRSFFIYMALGSITGALIGGLLVGRVSSEILHPLLAAILLISAIKVWKHK
jgi:hypothetical protein